jgi:hypothetical protein
LWSSVRDDISEEAVELPDVLEEEFHHSLGHDSCVSLNEVSPFPYQVHCYHDHVVSMCLWEFYHEVDQNHFPPFIGDVEGLKLAEGLMSWGFGLKAEVAGAAVLTYVSQHLWPPVGLGDKFEHLPFSRVFGDVGVMVLSDNLVTELSVLGYIDPISEKNESILFLLFLSSH